VATTYTTNLRLRLSDTLSSDAVYNLQRIDALGGTFLVDSESELDIRSIGDIHIEPESADIGGSGSGGTVRIGTSAVHRIDDLRVYALDVTISDDVNIGSDKLVLSGNRLSLNLSGDTSLTAPTTGTLATLQGTETFGNKTLTSPVIDGSLSGSAFLDEDDFASNSAVAVASQQSIKAYVASQLGGFTGSMAEGHIDVGNLGNVRTQVDTNTLGDIDVSTTAGLVYKLGSIEDEDISGTAAISQSKLDLAITDSEVDASAAISQSKLALDITDAEVAVGAAIKWSKINTSGSDITDLDFREHGDLTNSGINTHAQIDSHISNVSNPHSVSKAQILSGNLIADADVDAGAAIAQSKLALAITDSEVDAGAAIAQSKLALAITDSEVDAGAAIAQSKLALAITDSEVDAGAAIAQSKIDGLTSDLSGKLEAASNLSDLGDIPTARDNLGIASFTADWVTVDGTSKTVTHNLGTRDVMVQIYDSNYEQVYPDTLIRTDSNNIDMTSSQAPATSWRVLIHEVAGA